MRDTMADGTGQAPAIEATAGNTILVADGHVHFHACFDEDVFFSHAHANLAALAGQENSVKAILLAERSSEHAFSTWIGRAGDGVFATTTDPAVLRHRISSGTVLHIVAGRQMATADGLEVLGLGLIEPIADGLPFDETIARVHASGGLAIIPWGFGKWLTGGRGRMVADSLCREPSYRPHALGDSATRPSPSRTPAPFAQSAKAGLVVLPGTDPLPLPGEERRVGQYGFSACLPAADQTESVNDETGGRLLHGLRALLTRPDSTLDANGRASIMPVGRRLGWPAALGLQLRQRLGR